MNCVAGPSGAICDSEALIYVLFYNITAYNQWHTCLRRRRCFVMTFEILILKQLCFRSRRKGQTKIKGDMVYMCDRL